MDNYKNVKRIAYYSLGVGLLLVGASQLSPAQKSINKTHGAEMTQEQKESPLMKSSENNSMRLKHERTVNSLSPKNKSVFHSLSVEDKQRVVDAHHDGKDPHREMSKILKEDAKNNDSKPVKMSDNRTPAEKAMDKQSDGKQNIYD